ncbi:hypothetical protein [Burkholderia multivorans]|uniref:hypothetical protein n=1 Tax=Burkholderia multivorans TaxID=87883 RepID=UPI0011B28DAB|nr:hypothetical protein [Burkholderia multivorans]
MALLITITLFFIFAYWLAAFLNKDTTPKGKILPDLVPYAMHGVNVRSRLSDSDWNDLRNYAKRKKRFCCEVCGAKGKQQGFKHDVEAHEEWLHDHNTRTQKLTNILILCPLCHKFKHIALADLSGYGKQVREHIQKVNGWTPDQVELAINRAKHEVKQLKGAWKLDLTYLNTYGYRVPGITFTTQENHNCRKGVFE